MAEEPGPGIGEIGDDSSSEALMALSGAQYIQLYNLGKLIGSRKSEDGSGACPPTSMLSA